MSLGFRFLEAIERKKDCAFYHFLLGKLYWEMNGNLRADKKKCLAQFLKVEITNKTTTTTKRTCLEC